MGFACLPGKCGAESLGVRLGEAEAVVLCMASEGVCCFVFEHCSSFWSCRNREDQDKSMGSTPVLLQMGLDTAAAFFKDADTKLRILECGRTPGRCCIW